MSDPLVRRLRSVVGDAHVVTDTAGRITYECDGYTLERAVPELVVLPGSPAEVESVVRLLAEAGRPIVPRGAGTSLSGGCLPPPEGVVVALTRMRTIEAIDVENRQACVEAGVVNLALSRAAEPHGLHYAPDPSSQQACTLGGNIATNSGGPHTLKYGVTVNHVLALELVTPDGTRRWLGHRAPAAGGPDLAGLAVGHEGTFGIVTRAWVRLIPPPPAVRTLLAWFAEVDDAAGAVSGILGRGVVPAAVELMDAPILGALRDAYGLEIRDDADAVLLVEVDGPEPGLEEEASAVEDACRESGALSISRARDESERQTLWRARKQAFGALGRLSRNYCTQDGVVPRSRLPEVLKRIRSAGQRHSLGVANVFHAGDGNLHPVLLYDEREEGISQRVFAASDEILRACLELGGSLTGEHGIGVEKIGLMEEAFGADTLHAFRQVRGVFDPEQRANPNKLLPSASGCSDTPTRARRPGRQVPL